MRDTCTDHFEPLRFDRVGSRSQGRSKYGAMWGKWGQFWAVFCPYHTPPFLILTCGTQSCCTLRYLSINVMFERLRGKAAFPLVAMVFKSTAAPTVHTRHLTDVNFSHRSTPHNQTSMESSFIICQLNRRTHEWMDFLVCTVVLVAVVDFGSWVQVWFFMIRLPFIIVSVSEKMWGEYLNHTACQEKHLIDF